MQRSFFQNSLSESPVRSGGMEAARRWILFGVLLMLLTGMPTTRNEKETAAAELENPMEKLFAENETDSPEPEEVFRQNDQFAKRANFSDHTIPAASPKTSKKKIRQVSGQASDASAGVWDSAASTDSEMTLADWGAVAAPQRPAPPSPTYSNYPDFSANSPFPTGGDPTENRFQAGGYGFGAGSNPSSFGNVPPMQGNPYAGFAGAAPGAMQNPYANPYGQTLLGDMSGVWHPGYYDPGVANPYAASFAGNPYGYGGMQDPYGMMGNPAQQQMALYQAMLQQEMIRREVEQETEEEEERKKAESEAAEPEWSMKQLMPIHVTSPLGSTLLSCAKTVSPFCTPTGPHRGVGQPLEVRSWLDHPWYFGGFCGWISGSELVKGMIDQNDGAMGGLMMGYNINEYWGVESRLHFASIDIRETARGRQEFNDWYTALYPNDNFVPSLTTRTNRLSVFDVSVHYYPLGNAKWRPFFKYGLGLARESFIDTYGRKYREDTMTMPLGVGLRYWWNEHLAIQADLIDNVVFSSGIAKTQNNFAFCVGLSYSFGSSKKKRPTTYWPYTPSHGSRR